MKSLLPVLFLGLLTLWSGTLSGGATFSGAVTAHAAILGLSLLGAGRWRDPLDLGRRGRWLVPALLAAVAASCWLGPVRRAGIVGVLLLPAVFLLPPAVARCWPDARARRAGLIALCLLLGLVAALALVRWRLQASPRPAMPLGHHNLLSAWLVIVWPLALQAARGPGAGRLLAGVSGAVAVAALAASGSFMASCALLAQTAAAAWWWKGARPWLLLAALLVWTGPPLARAGLERLAPEPSGRAGPRAAVQRAQRPGGIGRAPDLVTGRDPSLRARLVYARAGWAGFRERPALGWGPGSVPWTAARHLRPVRGLNPPSEIVGDLHSWPVQAGYELGAIGSALAAAIGLLFGWRRLRELGAARTREPAEALRVRQGAWVGLIGGAVILAGNAPAHVVALPAALAVVAGAALAPGPRRRSRAGTVTLALAYVLPVVLALAPLERAHLRYDQARAAPDARTALERARQATRLDPGFPLYRARAAWLTARLDGTGREAADEAREAASSALAVAPLWLAAGALGLDADRPWAEEALERARALDPLSALPPFLLVQARPERDDAVELGARALAAEPRLDAAVVWEAHPRLWRAVRARLEWPAPDTEVPSSAGPQVSLVLDMDREPAVSFSLYAFRRAAWPADLVSVELRRERLVQPNR